MRYCSHHSPNLVNIKASYNEKFECNTRNSANLYADLIAPVRTLLKSHRWKSQNEVKFVIVFKKILFIKSDELDPELQKRAVEYVALVKKRKKTKPPIFAIFNHN